MSDDPFSQELLADIVANHVGVPAGELVFERCRTGKFNTTYFVSGPPEPLALRIAPPDDPAQMLFYEYRMMRQEPAIHARILAGTNVPIPPIIAHDRSHQRIDRDYLLMKQMPGTLISERAGLSRRAFATALHEVGQATSASARN